MQIKIYLLYGQMESCEKYVTKLLFLVSIVVTGW